MKLHIQILSFVLAAFTLAGSVGVGVFTHFCHNDGVEQSFLLPQANECEDEHDEIVACCAAETNIQESDCCSDEIDFFQIEFEKYESVKMIQFVPVEALQISSLDFVFEWTKEAVSFTNYANPPPIRIGKQYQIDFQVFRI